MRIHKKLAIKTLLSFALLVTPILGGAADRAKINDVGDALMCICGCGQVLPKCNHLNCPSSGPMLKELEAHIDAGESRDEIIKKFAEKYGYTVLSSPPATGFNLLAYVMPFAALILGAVIAIFVARRWKAAATATGPQIDIETPPDPRFQKVEEELRKFTPED